MLPCEFRPYGATQTRPQHRASSWKRVSEPCRIASNRGRGSASHRCAPTQGSLGALHHLGMDVDAMAFRPLTKADETARPRHGRHRPTVKRTCGQVDG